MSLRSPLGTALGTGSAKGGTSHWYAQRITAVALVVLGLWFLISLAMLGSSDYEAVVRWLRSPVNSTLAVIFVAVSAYHSVLGLQVILEDYVSHKNSRVVVLTLVKFMFTFAAVFGVLAVLRTAFGVSA
jgi:succinate dehydrogenase membrane anchor subunit